MPNPDLLAILATSRDSSERLEALEALERDNLAADALDPELLEAMLELWRGFRDDSRELTLVQRILRTLARFSPEDRRTVQRGVLQTLLEIPFEEISLRHSRLDHAADAFNRYWRDLEIASAPLFAEDLELYAEPFFAWAEEQGDLSRLSEGDRFYTRLHITRVVDLMTDSELPGAVRWPWARRGLRLIAVAASGTPSELFWPKAEDSRALTADYLQAARALAESALLPAERDDPVAETLGGLRTPLLELKVDDLRAALKPTEWSDRAVEALARGLCGSASWIAGHIAKRTPALQFLAEAFGAHDSPQWRALRDAIEGKLPEALPDRLPTELDEATALAERLALTPDELRLAPPGDASRLEAAGLPEALRSFLTAHDGMGRHIRPFDEWPGLRRALEAQLDELASEYAGAESEADPTRGEVDPRAHRSADLWVCGADGAGNHVYVDPLAPPRLLLLDHDRLFVAVELAKSPAHLLAQAAVCAYAEREGLLVDVRQRLDVRI